MNDVTKNRETYPRVSEIIGKQNEAEMRSIPIDYLVHASIRGSKIHKHCTAYVKGLFNPEIEEEYLPYFNEFVRWCDENVKRPILCSTRLYDDVKRFTGEFDMILELKSGKKALIDLKTSAQPSKTWALQLAAYDHLCKLNGLEYEEIFILHLKKKAISKKMKEENPNDPPLINAESIYPEDLNSSWDIFSSALECYDYFHRKEPKS